MSAPLRVIAGCSTKFPHPSWLRGVSARVCIIRPFSEKLNVKSENPGSVCAPIELCNLNKNIQHRGQEEVERCGDNYVAEVVLNVKQRERGCKWLY